MTKLMFASLLLAGCPLMSSSSTTPSSNGTSSSPSSGPSGGGGGGASEPTGGGGSSTLKVPDLTGKTEDEAKAIVKAAGFSQDMELHPLECEGAAKVDGKINCQDPEPGKVVARYAMVQVNVYHAQHFEGSVIRSQLDSLVGLTVEQAKDKLKGYGYRGELTVKPHDTFVQGCGEKKVCGTSGGSGISIDDALVLYTNSSFSIATPPP